MRRAVLTLAAVAAALFGGATSVLGHEVSGIEVDCDAQTITVSGIKFAEDLPRLVTVTGPGAYLETFEVTTDAWTHAFPLGPNGSYHVGWPGDGQYARNFEVECGVATPRPTPTSTSRPTPTVVGHTPRPAVTPPATDTAGDLATGAFIGGYVFVAAVGLLLLIHLVLTAAARVLGIRLPDDER